LFDIFKKDEWQEKLAEEEFQYLIFFGRKYQKSKE
jgi:hypothetical protein